jgi:hypothetical protein
MSKQPAHEHFYPEHAPAHPPPAMPPRKRRRRASKGNQSSHSALLDLPLPALALIHHHCNARARKALFAVSSGCFDWVLREARSIKLELPKTVTTAARKTLPRLLHRACSLSACSLKLSLDLTQPEGSKNGLLADLLEPGIQQSGWAGVANLVLEVRKAVSAESSDMLPTGTASSDHVWHVTSCVHLHAGRGWHQHTCQAGCCRLPSTAAAGVVVNVSPLGRPDRSDILLTTLLPMCGMVCPASNSACQ